VNGTSEWKGREEGRRREESRQCHSFFTNLRLLKKSIFFLFLSEEEEEKKKKRSYEILDFYNCVCTVVGLTTYSYCIFAKITRL
jgi:hypothetical protein